LPPMPLPPATGTMGPSSRAQLTPANCPGHPPAPLVPWVPLAQACLAGWQESPTQACEHTPLPLLDSGNGTRGALACPLQRARTCALLFMGGVRPKHPAGCKVMWSQAPLPAARPNEAIRCELSSRQHPIGSEA